MSYAQGWQSTIINATGATVVTPKPAVYGGYRILGAAGAFTMDVYDNDAAASGKRVDTTSVVAAKENERHDGMMMQNGITVNMSGDPTDDLIIVLWK